VVTALAAAGTSLAILGATWWATRLHDSTLATAIAVGGTVAGAGVVALVARRRPTAAKRVAIAATVVAGLGVAALSWSGTLVSVKAVRSQAAWQVAVDTILSDGAERGTGPGAAPSMCHWGPQLRHELRELEGFGRVDSICSSTHPGMRFVHLTQDDPMYPGAGGRRTGLVYAPDTPDAQVRSMCVQHLDGPWWLTASADPGCPPGFTFAGAP
jgi:hypothetical protein